MKICVQCGQAVAENVGICPTCGAEVAAGRTTIDDFRILEVLHEGYSSILCKARRDGEDAPVLIRIFTPPAGVDAQLADRLKHELEKLQALPETYFVRHLAIQQAADGTWYRISEWVDALNWGTLLSTGRLREPRTCLRLFHQIASILDGLHRIGHIIPHLNLDDILVHEGDTGGLKVKIDFKLSRFLDPNLERPRPMLARVLALHPDIRNQRPLDYRSDIWSLGKTFVEILCADPEVEDLQVRVDTLPVPAAIRTLIRLMLSDNPDLRPHSMEEVAAALDRVDEKAVRAVADAQDATPRAILQRVNIRLGLLAVVVVLMMAAGGGILWHYLRGGRPDIQSSLMAYANQYSGSVAFVMVDYWLQQGDEKVYRSRSEGTAFLASDRGALLTNRHVVCPWLLDRQLMVLIDLLQQQRKPVHFDYRIYLWFEGERAFMRLPALSESEEVDDLYVTDTAFSSRGPRRVWIAGVAPVPMRTRERVRSPLQDDYAVLKIDTVPPGLQPLPLAEGLKTAEMPKLTPLITLGFPLGSQTQAETVNVSVTSGHVRRTFDTLFQVDTSLHPGNSGGPFIDERGQVVGLATNVATTYAMGPFPVATPLSDIGLVLPIGKAAAFLEEIEAGQPKWNGEIDVALERRLKAVTDAALRHEWAAARDLADAALEATRTPSFLMASAVMHLCSGDHAGARRLFEQVVSIDPERNLARLMLLMTDWIDGWELTRVHEARLTALDWRSPDAFYGYLTEVLTGERDAQEALNGGYSAAERSWLHFTAGLIEARQGESDAALPLFEQAALGADPDDWSLYLALSQWDDLQRRRLAQAADNGRREDYRRQFEAFDAGMKQAVRDKQKMAENRAPIQSALRRSAGDLTAQRNLLTRLRELAADEHYILVAQAYYAAMDDDWDAALDYARQFLACPGRVNAEKLSLGLLEAEVLHRQGHSAAARDCLAAYRRRITDPWYRTLSGGLMDPALKERVIAGTGDSPENLLTGHAALGLWAEGSGDDPAALKHYREALGSYLDHRIEYDFAMARLKRLRRETD